jgi:hypothetical protein
MVFFYSHTGITPWDTPDWFTESIDVNQVS